MPVSGKLTVVGVGPGPEDWITPATAATLAEADELFGYGPYLSRLPGRLGQIRHASDNREEMLRARQALSLIHISEPTRPY